VPINQIVMYHCDFKHSGHDISYSTFSLHDNQIVVALEPLKYIGHTISRLGLK
jgi:hypothetical protein